MNIILLQPTDVLFFRDGRPMEGSLAGHGAAWPLPNVTDAAFHAALHRSGLNGHQHDQRRDQTRLAENARQFGSLVTAGPFPVRVANGVVEWYFPRPLDLLDATLEPALLPTGRFDSVLSSLPDPLEYAVANRLPPSKENRAKPWLRADAFQRYLDGGTTALSEGEAIDDSAFSDAEATIGIAIDPATGTTGRGEAEGKIYSARYLRLRDNWRLGVFAKTDEKDKASHRRLDLIPKLINEQRQILVGGQQRLCTATLCQGAPLPLPRGKTDGFACHDYGGRKCWLVKWILLSPAIWPEIPAKSKDGRDMTPHPGGWLPNWVFLDWDLENREPRPNERNGQVMLRSGQREQRRYGGKHSRGFSADSREIAAKLVAAVVPKPIPVTGWALAHEKADRKDGGAKSIHLAVPAGAVYYFEAASEEAARQLAAALNWHGSAPHDPSDRSNPFGACPIRNRRSTLLGEKGFGLGVCGTWNFFPGPSNPSDPFNP